MTATTLPPGLAELYADPHWVNWQSEPRPGDPKPTKVPYMPSLKGERRKAKAGDPATWGTVDTAVAAAAAGRFTGVGYEFHAGAGRFGIDIDNCLDPATGLLTPLARAIVCLADTYCEPSPSGRGIHIIGRGELPRPEIEEDRHGKKKGSYELYGGARYFRMTLQPFPGYDEVRAIDPATMRRLFALMWPEDAAPKPKPTPPPLPATPALADDSDLLERAFGAQHGEDFRRRHTGQYLHDDKSADDFAYLGTLRFWAQGDPARMRRIALSSGRVRDKWHTRRGHGDWLDYSIAKSLREPHEVYNPATYQSSTPPRAGTDAGDAPRRQAADAARIAQLEADVERLGDRLRALGEEVARKDARIRELETEVRALDACLSHPDQQVAGVALDVAEAVQDAYAQGKVLTIAGKDFARVVDKTSARRRSVPTFGRGKKTIAAARPDDTIVREETIKTDRFEGQVPISYFHVPAEHRQRRGDTLLYLLPPPPEQKRHGGRKKIAVPPEVAGQDAPVRRETRRVEQFFSLADNRPLGEIKSPPHLDYWQADGTELTKAEADLFQDEIGARPPRQAPPRWQPKVQTSFQLDGINTRGTSGQVETGRASVADLFQDETGSPSGTCPDCGAPVALGGYCAAHFAAHRDEHRRRYAADWGNQVLSAGD